MGEEPQNDLSQRVAARRRELEQRQESDEPADLRAAKTRKHLGAMDIWRNAVLPTPFEPPRLTIPDNLADISKSIAEGKRAEREALSAIIEQHTTGVQRAVEEMNRSSRKAADDMRRWTIVIAVLTAIATLAAVVSLIGAFH